MKWMKVSVLPINSVHMLSKKKPLRTRRLIVIFRKMGARPYKAVCYISGQLHNKGGGHTHNATKQMDTQNREGKMHQQSYTTSRLEQTDRRTETGCAQPKNQGYEHKYLLLLLGNYKNSNESYLIILLSFKPRIMMKRKS